MFSTVDLNLFLSCTLPLSVGGEGTGSGGPGTVVVMPIFANNIIVSLS